MVVLSAQLEVCDHNGDLGAGDDHNQAHKEQEAKQIIILILPDRREDEEELNEAASEWQETCHEGTRNRVHVPHLIWHLTRDLVCPYRL